MAFECEMGDYIYRVEKENGKYSFSRKLNNTAGEVFEELPYLHEVPTGVFMAFKESERKAATTPAQNPTA